MQKSLILLSLFFIAVNSQLTTITYQPLPTNVAVNNPERGFYVHTETFSTSYTSLDYYTLSTFRSQNITLVLRNFYLMSFIKSSISSSYLSSMQADFDTVRKAGLKCIVRFAYSNDNLETITWDATLSQILAHINQIAPILNTNVDVIAVVQTGFIGSWGEWYYTNNFGYPEPSDNDYANRCALVNALLAAVPASRMIQIRTPLQKRMITLIDTALTQNQAFQNTSVARIGHHNDCFLASDDDWGTYDDKTVDYPYLQQETKFTPMGGETCGVFLPRSGCTSALDEMQRFHYSYLNSGYHEDVIAGFKTNGCYYTIQNRIGYRFELINFTYPSTASLSSAFTISFTINNSGFASPFNKRVVYLVFRNAINSYEYSVALKTDIRLWASSAQTKVSESIQLPFGILTGKYSVYLSFPDSSQSISKRPEYSIRLANNGLWETATGYNSLQVTMTVTY